MNQFKFPFKYLNLTDLTWEPLWRRISKENPENLRNSDIRILIIFQGHAAGSIDWCFSPWEYGLDRVISTLSCNWFNPTMPWAFISDRCFFFLMPRSSSSAPSPSFSYVYTRYGIWTRRTIFNVSVWSYYDLVGEKSPFREKERPKLKTQAVRLKQLHGSVEGTRWSNPYSQKQKILTSVSRLMALKND